MDHLIHCEWKGNLAFEADIQGYKLMMDAQPEVGGQSSGASPKRLLLAGVAGCSGIDIGILIKKMRLKVDALHIEVGGELTTEMPTYYHRIHVVYTFTGKQLDQAKIEKAVKLSWEKYCGVTAMLQFAAQMTYEVKLVETA